MADTTASLVFSYQMQHYIQVGSTWYHVEELNSWDASDDDETYEPKYLDKKTQPTYVTSTKHSVEAENDVLIPSEWHTYCGQNEGAKNVSATYVRTLNVDISTGAALAETALAAFSVPILLNIGQLTQSEGDPLHQSFDFTYNGDKTAGTYNASTNTFTPASS